MSNHKAKIAGLVAGGGTGASLIGATAALWGPAANFGGDAVAQMVAGSVGLRGPALSVGIAAMGGPLVAGAAAAGVGYGAYSVTKWIFR